MNTTGDRCHRCNGNQTYYRTIYGRRYRVCPGGCAPFRMPVKGDESNKEGA